MKAIPLDSEGQFSRYADFAEEVYRDNPYWVPTDKQHLIHELSGNIDAGPGVTVQPFWVEDSDRILGTVTAVVDDKYNARWSERTGHLIYFEALPESDAAVDLLFAESCNWLRAQGCNRARASMFLGWQLPWTIDAYDEVPSIFHTYNPPYYHGYTKSAGFFTEKGVVQYQVEFNDELNERYRKMISDATRAGVTLRSWDFDRIEDENELFAELWNETFENHWGSSYLPASLMGGLTVGLKDLLVPDFCAFAELNGRTAGTVFSLPDLNQALHSLRGRPQAEIEAGLGEALGRIDHGVLLVIGVREEYRGKGINLAMAAKSYLAMIERGYRKASYTVVLDDNWPSRRTAEKLGCRVTRNFNVYAKLL
jgi:ribosomal protein S18 acetylase RimI-like enzyme